MEKIDESIERLNESIGYIVNVIFEEALFQNDFGGDVNVNNVNTSMLKIWLSFQRGVGDNIQKTIMIKTK